MLFQFELKEVSLFEMSVVLQQLKLNRPFVENTLENPSHLLWGVNRNHMVLLGKHAFAV